MPNDCPSDIVLKRYEVGELNAEESAQVAGHLAGCSVCQGTISGMFGRVATAEDSRPPLHSIDTVRAEEPDTTSPAGEPSGADPDQAGQTIAYRSGPARDPAVTGPVAFGDYELLNEIARGGMGVVYKARQRKANRIVALKMILSGNLAGEVDIQRFYAEAAAAANLEHPHIVPVYDVGEHEGQHYFSMGYVEGQSLAARTREGPLEPRAAAQMLLAISEAVAYAHQRGIVHRDLKPANVLLDAQGQPKVTDFGLAKNHQTDSGLTATGQILGTPSYMPPEQATGDLQRIGPRADVYSLGATFYHLLTGRAPFLAASTFDTLQQVLHQEPVAPRQANPAIDRDLETICLKCLQKDPAKRYESADALVADLERYLAGEPISARPVGRPERAWRWCRRNPLVATLSFAAIFLLVAGTAISTSLAWWAHQQALAAQQSATEALNQRQTAQYNLAASEENYQLARDAVEKYYLTVSENRLLTEPFMSDLRRELLQSASEFYRTFVDMRKGDAGAMYDLAWSYTKLAEISWQIGDYQESIDQLNEAYEAAEKVTLSGKDEFGVAAVLLTQVGIRLAERSLSMGHDAEAKQYLDTLEPLIQHRLDQDPQDADGRYLRSRWWATASQISARSREGDKAEELLRKQVAALESLRVDFPDRIEYRRDLAGALRYLGTMKFRSGDNDEAETLLLQSIAARQEVLANQPEYARARLDLSTALSTLAHIKRRQKQFEKAREISLEAVEANRQLVQLHPGVSSYQLGLAGILGNHAVIELEAGNPERAVELNAEAIEMLRSIVRQHPEVEDFARPLMAAEGNRGNDALAQRNWEEAISWFDQSNSTLESLLKNTPDDPRLRSVCRNNHWGRADAFAALERYDDAAEAFAAAIEFATEDVRSELRMARAMVVARSGDHATAVAAADQEMGLEGVRNVVLYDAAKVLMLAVAAIEKDPELDEAGQLDASRNAREMAMTALQRCYEEGYFEHPNDIEQLQSDTFAPLHDTESFQNLLESLANKEEPSVPL